MSNRRFAIRFAMWHPRMGYPHGVAMARTNNTYVRTQQTHVTKTQANHLLFLNARVGLWISRISRRGVTA
jgi:hypothetical protein